MGDPTDRWTDRGSRWRLRPWSYLGGLAIACFALQALTGITMAFSYQPTPDHAYASAYYISNVMPYGWLVRTVHSWGASLMLVFAGVHAVQVFVSGSYKGGREANWFVGTGAFLVTGAAAFTGRLLPWDQAAYWSTSAGVSLLAQAPVFGPALADLMLGGDTLGATSLTRFHASHVTLLPATLMLLLVAHIWIARRQRSADTRAPVPLYPDLLISAGTTVALLLSVFAVLAILIPVPLDMRADPGVRISQAKPAWYLLSLYSLARWIPRPVAAIVPIALGALLIAVPLIDRGISADPRRRALALIAGGLVIAVIGSLTLIGLAI